jgi:hypothetical protein
MSRVNYSWQLDVGVERVRLFRKTEVGGGHFRFLVVFGSWISEFPGEMVILGLV